MKFATGLRRKMLSLTPFKEFVPQWIAGKTCHRFMIPLNIRATLDSIVSSVFETFHTPARKQEPLALVTMRNERLTFKKMDTSKRLLGKLIHKPRVSGAPRERYLHKDMA
ncbi:unnamed protein product [Clavelina lepadiformis]|uniref:Uncharacterized protein n=1 Tax=Clavelina lepadiformis TaxID=159417 RepID=A0ABP0EZ13_CLALP